MGISQKIMIIRLWTLISLLWMNAQALDPCQRQPFKINCDPSSDGSEVKSQFVLRYYRRGNQCVSYPYGHCRKFDDEPVPLFKYKSECEERCLSKSNESGLERKDSVRKSTSGEVKKSRCIEQRDSTSREVQEQLTTSSKTFKPSCTSDGAYEPLQCENSLSGKVCWCVDQDGSEITGTRSTPGSTLLPSCNGAITNAGLDLDNGECSALPDPGPCPSANKTKWYYDQTAKSCKSFEYTGCGGNSNNYPTKESCEDRCSERKTCDDQQVPLQDENFNTVDCSSKACPQSYTCKRGRSSSICCPTFTVATASSLTAQDSTGTCAMPKDRGTCDKFELRFFYNKDIGECKYFFYSGCGGNTNNFKELAECQRLCGKQASTTQKIQEPTSVNIPAPSSFTSLFAQRRTTTSQQEPVTESMKFTKPPENLPILSDTRTSEKFAKTQVLTKNVDIPSSTTTTAAPKSVPFQVHHCRLSPDVGPCTSRFTRYFFNVDVSECQPFTYGGCRGNNNNFLTLEDCKDACRALSSNVCTHPLDHGTCDHVHTRWWFDSTDGFCKQFAYNGCDGNGNNFDSKEQCERRCILLTCPDIKCGPSCIVFTKHNGCQECACVRTESVTATILLSPSSAGPVNRTTSVGTTASSTASQRSTVILIQGTTTSRTATTTPRSTQQLTPTCPQVVSCPSPCIRMLDAQGCQECSCARSSPRQQSSASAPKISTPPVVVSIISTQKTASNESIIVPIVKGKDIQELLREGIRANCPPVTCKKDCIQVTNPLGCQECACTFVQSAANAAFPVLSVADQADQLDRDLVVLTDKTESTSSSTKSVTITTSSLTRTTQPPAPSFNPKERYTATKAAFSRRFTAGGERLAVLATTQQLPVAVEKILPATEEDLCETDECDPLCFPITNHQNCMECVCPSEIATRKLFERKTTVIPAVASATTTSWPKVENKVIGPIVAPKAISGPKVTANVQKVTQPTTFSLEKCDQPRDPGPCKGPFQTRWWFNRDTHTCETFEYGGCSGNKNHFFSVKECEIHCLNPLNFLGLRPPKEKIPQPQITQNPQFQSVQQKQAGVSQVEDACSLPKDQGPCINFVSRWFFNSRTGQCEQFQFGSCGGNLNNFDSEDVCRARCVTVIDIVLPQVCALPKDPGPCNGYNPRFYFNSRNLRCELFVWGGCQGNENNFENKQICDFACPVNDNAVRDPNRPQGQPFNSFPPASNFHTSQNQFQSQFEFQPQFQQQFQQQQQQQFEPQPPAPIFQQFAPSQQFLTSAFNSTNQFFLLPYECAEPRENGSCDKQIRRWFFNFKIQTCEQFVYNGCGGNANNFDSQKLCKEKCRPQLLPPSADIGTNDPRTQAHRLEHTAQSGAQSHFAAQLQIPTQQQQPQQQNRAPLVTPPSNQIQRPTVSFGAPPAVAAPAGLYDVPRCPNDQPAVTYSDGRPILCLPGRDQCPPSTSCYFNGLDFTCCPISNDPYEQQQPQVQAFNSQGQVFYNDPVAQPAYSSAAAYSRQKRQGYGGGGQQQAVKQTSYGQQSQGIFAPTGQRRQQKQSVSLLGPPTIPGGPRLYPQKQYCFQPKACGTCKGSHLRWYYDPKADQCKLFYFTGCQGNQNNFGTRTLCEKECLKTIPIGLCPGNILPLGGRKPIICGIGGDAIACPDGYFCQQGLQNGICCLNVPSDPALPINAPKILPRPPGIVPSIPGSPGAPGVPAPGIPAPCPDRSRCTKQPQLLPPESPHNATLHDSPISDIIEPETDSHTPKPESSVIIQAQSLFPSSPENPVVKTDPHLTKVILASTSTDRLKNGAPAASGAPGTSSRRPQLLPPYGGSSYSSGAQSGGYGQPQPQQQGAYGQSPRGQQSKPKSNVFGPPTLDGGDGGGNQYTATGCPDGSNPLRSQGGIVRCGAGFDGSPLCPKNYYCHIDTSSNLRVCCTLGSLLVTPRPGCKDRHSPGCRPSQGGYPNPLAYGARSGGSSSQGAGEVFLPPTVEHGLGAGGDGSGHGGRKCGPNQQCNTQQGVQAGATSYGSQGATAYGGQQQQPAGKVSIFGPPTSRNNGGCNQGQRCNQDQRRGGSASYGGQQQAGYGGYGQQSSGGSFNRPETFGPPIGGGGSFGGFQQQQRPQGLGPFTDSNTGINPSGSLPGQGFLAVQRSPNEQTNQFHQVRPQLMPLEDTETNKDETENAESNTNRICALTPDVGNACSTTPDDKTLVKKPTLLMYYYSKQDKECKLLTYKGCGGNENRFTSRKECLRLCKGES